VGMKGSRIHGIVRELRNENIDVISYTIPQSAFLYKGTQSCKDYNQSNLLIENKKGRNLSEA